MANQNPQIKIPDLLLELRSFYQELDKKVSELHQTFRNYTTFIIGVLAIGFIVLLFALVTLLIQVLQFYQTFQNQNNELKIQSGIIKNDVDEQQSMIKSQEEMKKDIESIKATLNTNNQ